MELISLHDTTKGPITYERLTQGMPSNLPLAFGRRGGILRIYDQF